MNVLILNYMLQWIPIPLIRQATYSGDKVQYMKILSQKSITRVLLLTTLIEKDHQKSSNTCPHEHSQDLARYLGCIHTIKLCFLLSKDR